MFDNISGFKQDFTPLLKDFDIQPILTIIKNLQANTTVEQVYQETLNVIVNKDIDYKVFDYIDPLVETLTYIEWYIRASYHRNIGAEP